MLPGILSLVKKHWHTLLLAWAVLALFLFHEKSESDWTERVKQLEGIHAAEIKQIDEVRKVEQQQNDANVRKLQDALAGSQKSYDEGITGVVQQKQTRIKQIVQDDGEDPVKLANELARVTEFKVKQ